MSGLDALPPAQQVERLARLADRALARWDLAGAKIELIKHRENAVFSVDAGGSRFALRVHRDGYHSDAALRSELAWMAALAEAGIRTPDVVPTRSGEPFAVVEAPEVPEPRQCDLTAWIEGRALGSVEGGLVGERGTLLRCYRTLGELAARLHGHAARWQRPAGFERHAWDVEGLVGERPVWGRFWELAALTPAQRELLLRARERLRGRLEAFGGGADRYGLIHADFLPENALVTDDGVVLIDFDDAGFGWHLFDLSTPLVLHEGQPVFDALREALVGGYRSLRPLPDAHLGMLPGFFLARALTYLGWAHTRSETETARALTPFLVEGACARAEAYLAG